MSKFIIVSEFGETLDLALDLKRRGDNENYNTGHYPRFNEKLALAYYPQYKPNC